MTTESVIADSRPTCRKCGRFVAYSACGTVYAPWGDQLQYDGWQDLVRCGKCGLQEQGWVPTRWVDIEVEA